MLLGDSLTLKSKLVSLFDVPLNFCLNVLLVASSFKEPFSASLDVKVLLVKSLHFELDEFILELVQLDFCVHCVNFISNLSDNCFDVLNVILDLSCDAQK